jgi:hypothetical protein
MRECVLLLFRVTRASWHLLAFTRMRVGVALAARHAEVPRSITYAFWSARMSSRVAVRACVCAFAW